MAKKLIYIYINNIVFSNAWLRLLQLFIFFSLLLVKLQAQKNFSLFSPDKNINCFFSLDKNELFYKVDYKNKPVIQKSSLSLVFKEGNFTNNLKVIGATITEADEIYTLTVGKTKNVNDHYKQLVISLQQITAPFLKLDLVVKAFNDGIAFRYQIPQWENELSFTLLEEKSTFNITGDAIINALFFPNYTSSHEGLYQKVVVKNIPEDTLIDLPALFQLPGNLFIAVTEASLVDYAGMYLSKKENSLVSTLSPLPGQTAEKVKALLPHQSPWRVLLISDHPGALIESNMITSLAEPCKIKDVSWIHPGKSTFPWWNGNVMPDTINAPGNNFISAKYYIDFCARNKIDYHAVVEYGLHQWYVDDGAGFQPGPHSDVTKPVPGLDMKEICDYAKTKNVGIRVWVHWAALYPKLDTAFALFEKWGLTGMMVDFMDRDDQQMVNIQNEILEKAAKHHLHIQFHGAYKPTGMSRTWPNEYTREGTLNYEINKWGSPASPDMDIKIPFTRMLAGSTDYHLGGFRAVPAAQYKAQYTRPLMAGTRCHSLAMYVVLENYLQMVCDYPEAYEGQPGFEFIQDIPTTWDETKVIDAKIDEYIIIARRKNNKWYIGAITNHQSRAVTIPLNFLNEGTYTSTLFSDSDDAAINPNKLNKKISSVSKGTPIIVQLAAGGGMVMQLIKN